MLSSCVVCHKQDGVHDILLTNKLFEHVWKVLVMLDMISPLGQQLFLLRAFHHHPPPFPPRLLPSNFLLPRWGNTFSRVGSCRPCTSWPRMGLNGAEGWGFEFWSPNHYRVLWGILLSTALSALASGWRCDQDEVNHRCSLPWPQEFSDRWHLEDCDGLCLTERCNVYIYIIVGQSVRYDGLAQNRIWYHPGWLSFAWLMAWLGRTSIALESVTLWPESLRVLLWREATENMGKLEFAWNWCTLSYPIQFSVTPTWWWMKVKGLTHHIFKTVDSKPGTRFWPTWRVWVEDRCKAPRKGSCLTTRRPYNTFDILSCWLLHIHMVFQPIPLIGDNSGANPSKLAQ